MPRVFISHSTQDRPFVEDVLLPLLRENGIQIWYAPNEIRTTQEWERMILRGLISCDWFLVVLSSDAATSKWVKTEVHWAIDNREGRVIPLLLRDCNLDDIHLSLRTIHYLDFRGDLALSRDSLLQLWEKGGDANPKNDLSKPPCKSKCATTRAYRTILRSRLILIVKSVIMLAVLSAGALIAGLAVSHVFNPIASKRIVGHAVTAGGFKIRVAEEYRGNIAFVVSSGECDHFIVNRLYLEYLSEFKFRPSRPLAEAIMIRTSYSIPLSLNYSEYDLLPQTKDNLEHGYEYKGDESESFGVSCSGFRVAKVQICANVLDVTSGKVHAIKSDEISMVRSSDIDPLWDSPISVKHGRYSDQFEPLLYKAITHEDSLGFIDSLEHSVRARLKEQLTIVLNRAVAERLDGFDEIDRVRGWFNQRERDAGPVLVEWDIEEVRRIVSKNADQICQLALTTVLPGSQVRATTVHSKVNKSGTAVDVDIWVQYESALGRHGIALTFEADKRSIGDFAIRSSETLPGVGRQDIYRAEIKLQELWKTCN